MDQIKEFVFKKNSLAIMMNLIKYEDENLQIIFAFSNTLYIVKS